MPVSLERSPLRVTASLVAVWWTAALSLACAPAAPEWAGVIEERDGARYVTNPETAMWADAESPVLRFELEQTFGSDGVPREAMLGNPFQVAFDVDAEGSVYVLDGQASRLVAFAADGSVLWSDGRAGEGPGELNNPRGIAVSPAGFVAVGNDSSNRLEICDTGGEYQRSVSLVEDPVDLTGARSLQLAGFLDEDTLVLTSPMWGGAGSRGHIVDLEPLAIAGELEWNQLPDLQMSPNLATGMGFRVERGLILAGSSAGYRFRIYDKGGSLQLEVRRPVDYPTRPGFYEENGSRGISNFGAVSPPLLLPEGYMLIHASWTVVIDDPDAVALAQMRAFRAGERPEPRERASSFDLFDESGRFLYSLPGDPDDAGIGDPGFVGPDGKLYTLADDPFPQIRRYRVVVAER